MSKPVTPIETYILRYNFVILIVISSAVLGASIFLAYSTFINAADPSNAEVTSTVPTNFDKDTREAIDELHTSDDPNITVDRPPGRINPFLE